MHATQIAIEGRPCACDCTYINFHPNYNAESIEHFDYIKIDIYMKSYLKISYYKEL